MTVRGDLLVRDGRPADDAERDAFVMGHSSSTFFHRSGWRRVVAQVMGHDERDLIATENDRIVGVLPMMGCRGMKGRMNLISMPYAVYGGGIGVDASVTSALVERAAKRARAEGVGQLELRCLEDPGLTWSPSNLHATFIRPLPDDPQEILASMPKKARAEARKARNRHGLQHEVGIQHLGRFIDLFQMNKQSLGSPALPAVFFESIVQELGSDLSVHVITHEGVSIAAVMGFHHQGDFLAYYSGSLPGVDRTLSASNYMYLALQEWAVEQGFQRFDFGRSRKDSGAHRFKVHQGFQPADLHYRHLLIRDSHLPSLNPSNPKLRGVQSVWRKLPAGVARVLSRPLSRYLP